MAKRFLIWFWSGGGGGSVFAVNLARRLRLRFGGDNVVLSLRADDPAVDRARALGLDVRIAEGVSDRRRPIETIAALADNQRTLAQHARDTDVVILPMNFASAAPLSVRLKAPLVYVSHDPEPHPGDYAPMLQRFTQAVLVNRARRVVAMSEYGASRLRALGVPAAKLAIAPLQSVFEPAPLPIRTEQPVRLLFAGRMIAYKGLDILATALERIAGREDWRLIIAGDGPALDEKTTRYFSMPQVQRLARRWFSDEELETMIARADILLLPYRSATQSGVLAQSMTMGRPSIVTPVGALAEQIGGGSAGWVAERADAAAFAAALQSALDRPEERTEKAAAAIAIARAACDRDDWGWLAAI